MKKRILLALLAFVTAASLGFSNTVSFRLNYFVPSAQSDFWKVEFENMNYKKSNFQDSSFGFAYEYFMTQQLSLVFNLDTFSKNKAGFYKDYVGYQFDEDAFAFPNDYEGDFTPGHRLNVSITPIQVSLKIAPFGRRIKLIPYFGAGGGMYLWSVRMQGDMIDFSDEYVYDDPDFGEVPVYPIYAVDALEGENFGKIGFGYHVFGGFMFPVANRMTMDVEFKFNSAKAKFTEAFEGFERFDIGGLQFSIGINYWF